MADKKRKILKQTSTLLLLSFILLFPFGQLLRVNISLLTFNISFPVIDIVALTSIPLLLFSKYYKVKKTYFGFLIIAAFSLILSIVSININFYTGLFYLIRLISYFTFAGILSYAVVDKSENFNSPRNLLNALIVTVCFVALFGWIQYFWIPDLRDLIYLGWDDHLFRLAGTYLDPGFTGIILVFGSLLSLVTYRKSKNSVYLIIAIFLILSLLFTYSRASYLAFIAGFIYIYRTNVKKYALYAALAIIAAYLLLPRPEGYGVKLERTHSILLKIENYRETFKLFSRYPLFGVGYNNICEVRIKENADKGTFGAHSCSGSDSSLLLVLATTGIVGLLSFAAFLSTLIRSVKVSVYKDYFYPIILALLLHSLFLNSMFYAWVMGFVGIIYATTLKGVRGDR